MSTRQTLDLDLLLVARYLDGVLSAEERKELERRLAAQWDLLEKSWAVFIRWLEASPEERTRTAAWLIYGTGMEESARDVSDDELKHYYGLFYCATRIPLPAFEQYREFRERYGSQRRRLAG